jgi:hypothetical protein
MNRLVVSSSSRWRVLRWVGLAAAGASLWACTSRTLEMPTVTPSVTDNWTVTQKINNNLDLLFMVDDSSSMTAMQQKLLVQLPNFLSFLQKLPSSPTFTSPSSPPTWGPRATSTSCAHRSGTKESSSLSPRGPVWPPR